MSGRGQDGRGKGVKMTLKSFWLEITVMSELNLKINTFRLLGTSLSVNVHLSYFLCPLKRQT